MKRQRGRGGQQRKPGQHPNRSFDSNGPDIKVRGPAPHIYERYLQLARDANSAGDRVQAENFLQHAEHYFRVMRAMQPAVQPQPQYDRFGEDLEDSDEEGDGEGMEPDQFRPHQSAQNYQQPRQNNGEYQQRDNREPRENRGDYQQRENRGEYQQRENRQYDNRPYDNRQQDGRQQEVRQEGRQDNRNYAPREQQPREEGQYQQNREGGEANAQQGGFEDGPRRNRRGRRNRFRTDGGPERDGAEHENDGPAEGFGDSTPAFLVEDDRS